MDLPKLLTALLAIVDPVDGVPCSISFTPNFRPVRGGGTLRAIAAARKVAQ